MHRTDAPIPRRLAAMSDLPCGCEAVRCQRSVSVCRVHPVAWCRRATRCERQPSLRTGDSAHSVGGQRRCLLAAVGTASVLGQDDDQQGEHDGRAGQEEPREAQSDHASPAARADITAAPRGAGRSGCRRAKSDPGGLRMPGRGFPCLVMSATLQTPAGRLATRACGLAAEGAYHPDRVRFAGGIREGAPARTLGPALS